MHHIGRYTAVADQDSAKLGHHVCERCSGAGRPRDHKVVSLHVLAHPSKRRCPGSINARTQAAPRHSCNGSFSFPAMASRNDTLQPCSSIVSTSMRCRSENRKAPQNITRKHTMRKVSMDFTKLPLALTALSNFAMANNGSGIACLQALAGPTGCFHAETTWQSRSQRNSCQPMRAAVNLSADTAQATDRFPSPTAERKLIRTKRPGLQMLRASSPSRNSRKTLSPHMCRRNVEADLHCKTFRKHPVAREPNFAKFADTSRRG